MTDGSFQLLNIETDPATFEKVWLGMETVRVPGLIAFFDFASAP